MQAFKLGETELREPQRKAKPGCRCRLQDLKAEPQLSGCYGIVSAYKKESGRYVVAVDATSDVPAQTLAVKRQNIYVLCLREIQELESGETGVHRERTLET